MNLRLPAQLIELFGRYRQLNSILNENWRDTASKDFFSNFVDPVNSGWKTFHRQAEEASATLKRISSTRDSNESLLRKTMSNLSSNLSHSQMGLHQHYSVETDSGFVDILVPWSKVRSTNDKEFREYMSGYFPEIDEDTPIVIRMTVG